MMIPMLRMKAAVAGSIATHAVLHVTLQRVRSHRQTCPSTFPRNSNGSLSHHPLAPPLFPCKTMDDDEEPDDLIPCDCIGAPIFVENGRSFYAAYTTCDLRVKIGDCARISIEGSNEAYGFGQVLAIFADDNEEVFIEVRWFKEVRELLPRNRKIVGGKENELVETDILQDIPAGSVNELIDICGTSLSLGMSMTSTSSSPSEAYMCSHMESSSGALQRTTAHNLLQRGMGLSHYAHGYEDFLEALEPSQELDDYALAIQRMHISVVPDELPCRSAEHRELKEFVRKGVREGYSKASMYIYGYPGTGKTASVHSCIKALRREVAEGRLADFRFIEINCLRLKAPADAYTQLWRGISGYHKPAAVALKCLNDFFNGRLLSAASAGHADMSVPIVCVLDELDYLLTKDFKIMYNFFDWPLCPQASLILLGIANNLNLPDALTARLESRSATNINQMIFSAYTFEQVHQILDQRLAELRLKEFSKNARELLARKAASLGGDLRKALQLCKAVLEQYRAEQRKGTGTGIAGKDPFLRIIQQVIEEHKQSPMIAFVTHCCALDRQVLVVLCRQRDMHGEQAQAAHALTAEQVMDLLRDLSTRMDLLHLPPVLLPPHHLLLRALGRLVQTELVCLRTVHGASGGYPIDRYAVSSRFQTSDLRAALVEDPLKEVVSS